MPLASRLSYQDNIWKSLGVLDRSYMCPAAKSLSTSALMSLFLSGPNLLLNWLDVGMMDRLLGWYALQVFGIPIEYVLSIRKLESSCSKLGSTSDPILRTLMESPGTRSISLSSSTVANRVLSYFKLTNTIVFSSSIACTNFRLAYLGVLSYFLFVGIVCLIYSS